MTNNAAARAAALACAVFAYVGAVSGNLAFADEPCTRGRVDVDRENRKLVVHFENRCQDKVDCKITWKLRCNRGASEVREASVELRPHGSEYVEANALSCGDGDWDISPPKWRCDSLAEEPTRSSGKRQRR